jgi:hypothetical protein
MVLGVYSANEVRKYINEQKYPYKGKSFNITKQTFYNIIRNVVYTGKIRVKEYKKEGEQIVIGLHPRSPSWARTKDPLINSQNNNLIILYKIY